MLTDIITVPDQNILPTASAPVDKESSQSRPNKGKPSGPVALKKKSMVGDVPEIPFPERGATVGMTPIFCISNGANLKSRLEKAQPNRL